MSKHVDTAPILTWAQSQLSTLPVRPGPICTSVYLPAPCAEDVYPVCGSQAGPTMSDSSARSTPSGLATPKYTQLCSVCPVQPWACVPEPGVLRGHPLLLADTFLHALRMHRVHTRSWAMITPPTHLPSWSRLYPKSDSRVPPGSDWFRAALGVVQCPQSGPGPSVPGSGRSLALRQLRVGEAGTGGCFEVLGWGSCLGSLVHSEDSHLAEHVPQTCGTSCLKPAWSKASSKPRGVRSDGSQEPEDAWGLQLEPIVGLGPRNVGDSLDFSLLFDTTKGSTFLWKS